MAGCLGPHAPPDAADAAPPAQRAPSAAPSDGGLILTHCAGLTADSYYAGATAPGQRPSGWPGAPPTLPATWVGVRALLCQRIALGPFERGPIHLAFDWHNNARAPAGCGGEGGASAVLATAWTDDAELAAHLRDRFALPAFVASFSEEATAVAGGGWRTWTWAADGAPSSVGVLAEGPASPKAGQVVSFWPAGDGVGRLVLNVTESPSPVLPAQGSMRPPMLAGDFTGLGQWLEGYEASGTLTLFTDSDCQAEADP